MDTSHHQPRPAPPPPELPPPNLPPELELEPPEPPEPPPELVLRSMRGIVSRCVSVKPQPGRRQLRVTSRLPLRS